MLTWLEFTGQRQAARRLFLRWEAKILKRELSKGWEGWRRFVEREGAGAEAEKETEVLRLETHTMMQAVEECRAQAHAMNGTCAAWLIRRLRVRLLTQAWSCWGALLGQGRLWAAQTGALRRIFRQHKLHAFERWMWRCQVADSILTAL
jgi:hypothetical protein